MKTAGVLQEFTAVYAVSRHPLDYEVKRAKHIRLDLTDKEAIKQVCISTCCWHACEPSCEFYLWTVCIFWTCRS